MVSGFRFQVQGCGKRQIVKQAMFSLRTLFVVVAVAALALAALFAKTLWPISAFVVLTLGILCWSFLQRAETFWRGLCVFGTVYLLCALLPMFSTVSNMLPSARLSEMLVEMARLNKPLPDKQGEPFRGPLSNPFSDEGGYWPGKHLVLHCSAALLFGATGGILLQWTAHRKKGIA
jgi:hypothetical protein